MPFTDVLIPAVDHGVIWAADVRESDTLFRILDQIAEDLVMVKVGHPLLLACGTRMIAEIHRRAGIPVIADAKLCDIPEIVKTEASILYEAEADGVVVVGISGEESVRAAIEVDRTRMVYVLTEFTHAQGMIPPDLADDCAKMAKRAGAYGIQAPGTKPQRVKELRAIVGDEMKIISCGIGQQGGKLGSAASAGANYEIVGRSITHAPDPRGLVKQMLWRIGEAASTRM